PQVEDAEVTDHSPNDGQHAKAGHADVADKNWQGEQSHQGGRSAAQQIPQRIPGQQAAPGQVQRWNCGGRAHESWPSAKSELELESESELELRPNFALIRCTRSCSSARAGRVSSHTSAANAFRGSSRSTCFQAPFPITNAAPSANDRMAPSSVINRRWGPDFFSGKLAGSKIFTLGI